MKFSEYRRLREEEEQDTGTKTGVSSVTEERKTTGTRFTDIMKEREPERYSNMMAERNAKKASNISDFTNKVNQHAAYTNMQTADAVSYINRNKDTYTADAAENASRRKGTYDSARQQAFDLMKEAWSNEDLDTELRQQSLNILLNSVGNMQQADKANKAFADYMGQFANEDAFTRTKEAERKQEEASAMTIEELQKKIEESQITLDGLKKQESASYLEDVNMNQGVGALMQQLGLYKPQGLDSDELLYQNQTLENDIQSYKNELFARQQQEAMDRLTDKTKESFENLYILQNEGYNKGSSNLEKVLDNLTGTSHIPVQRAYEDEAKEKAAYALEEQGISRDEFDSLYEYYKFARDAENNDSKVEEWNQNYENAGILGKIGMNAGTVASAPVRGVTAAQEFVDSLHYKNEYAPLNTNSNNYEYTNYTDTVRNATSQDIDNNTLNFLYQTGMSMADMGTLLPLSAVTGGTASLALMGTNAATSAAKEATARGVSKEQALMTGLAAGAAEVVFEKVSLDHFWDIARNQGKAATRNAFLNIIAQAGIEGSEEVFTDLANTFTDNLINRGLSEWYQNMDSYYKQGMSMTEAQKAATVDYCKQLGSSFLGGALSGGLFGTGAVVNTSLTGKKNTMTADDYMQVAEGIDTDQASYATQADYDKAMSVQHLAQDLSQKENITDFEKGLFNQAAEELSNINYNEQNNPKEQIRQIASAMENETISRAFIADYKEGMPVETYTRAFNNFYHSGYTELPFERALEANPYIASVIDEPTLYGIYCLGQNQAAAASEQYASQEQKELVTTMANALGVKVEYQDIPGANGMYKDGTIYISNKTINPSMVVMSHELTHALKDTAVEEYTTYENYVIDYFKEYHAKEYEALYTSMAEHYGNDEALIREEIAANAAETFLTDAEAVNKFVKENRTIAERIADFLNNFITKLKEVYQSYTAKGKAGKMLAEDIEVYEKARNLWYEAVNTQANKKSLATATDEQAPVLTSETTSGTASKELGENEFSTENSSLASITQPLNKNISQNQGNDNTKFMKKQGIEDEIQRWFDSTTPEKRKKSGGSFKLGTTSETLKSIGLDEVDVYMDHSKIQKILDAHEEMSISLIKSIPEMLENPVMITSSLSQPKTSIVIFSGDVVDGKAVMLSLMINNGKGKITDYVVTSAYGRNKNGVVKYLNDATYYYIDPNKNRTDSWLSALRVQFPSATTKYGSIRSIPKTMRNNNEKFSFKGVNAAENDMTALAKATEMEQKGTEAWKIFHETGWFRGADGKWRFEIDDSEAEVFRYGDAAYRTDENYHKYQKMWSELDFENPEFEKLEKIYRDMREPQYLSDYLVHDTLYKNYPFLRYFKIKKLESRDGIKGYASYSKEEIGVDKNLFDEYSKHKLKKTLLHEVQHLIQKYEHFANGANYDTWKDIDIKEHQWKIKEELKRKSEAFEGGTDEFKELIRKLNQLRLEKNHGEEFEKLYLELDEKYPERFEMYEDAVFGLEIYKEEGESLDNFTKYSMTAGEIEARDVAERSDFTAEERRKKYPTTQTKYGVIFAENKENPFEPKFSLKSYSDDIGIRFSDKEGGDLFESILMGTDNIDYESVLVNDGSESYRATMDLIQESARILKDGIAAAGKLKNVNVTRDMAQAMATHYLDKYSATFDADMLTDNLYNIFAYIQKTEDVNYQDMIRVMQEVCKPVIATSQKIDKELMKQYNDFRKTVRSYHLKLNREQKAEIASVYDSFNKFKNVNQNKYTFRENGSYLDSVWSGLVEASGYALSYDTPSSEQMLALHDYMTTLEKSVISPAEDMNNSQVAYDMALNIYTDYFKLIGEDKQAIKNLSTQMQKKLNEYKKDVRNDYKDKFKKYKEEAEIKKQAEINRLQKQIRELERERDDALYAADDITVNLLDGNINALEYKIGKISKRNAEKLAKLTAQSYNRSVQRAITRQQTEIKNHIKKNMFDLQNRLAKPKENKFIPQGLVRATIDLCEAVNIDTGRSEKLAERLNEMSRLYAKLKEDKDYAISSEYDEHTQAAIERLREVFTGRNITMLNMMELKEVDNLITQLRFQIVNAGKLINMEKSKEVYETAVQCMDEINAAKSYDLGKGVSRGLNHYTTAMLSPKRQFRRMSGYKEDSVLNQIYEDLNNGQQKQMQVLMETARIFDPVTKGEHNQKAISKLVGKEKKDWIDIGLKYKNLDPVIVPRAFRVSLAMHIQNKANLDHIIYGGLTIPEPKAYQRGDYKTAYATGTTIYFMPSDIKSVEDRQIAYNEAVKKLKSVVAEMTPYERAMVKCSEKFFHEYTGEKINETSLQLNGYKKARVHNYFPIRTDSNFNHSEIEGLVRNGTLENMGMLNSRVGARNPILLEDITQVIKRQSENVAKYYGLAIPIRNFNKIYNTTKIGYLDSTKSTIARKWGVTGQKYIEDLLTDLQSKRGQGSSILDTLQGNFAQAVLSNNISVALQQVVAYPTAASTLGWDAVIKGMKYIPTKLDMENIAKYTPLLWYRNQGTGTEEIGDINKQKNIRSALASKATTALEHHNMSSLAKLTGWAERGMNWQMDMLQRIDTKAVGSLWKASEIYVQDKLKVSPKNGEDAYYRTVAKVFNNCVDDTQANYVTMQRPDILRNPSKAYKMIFLFKTQPLQNFNIMYDAFGNLRVKAEAYNNAKGLNSKIKDVAEQEYILAKREFARAVSSQVAAAVGVFCMKFVADVLKHRMDKYRNEEDDITGWQIVEELVNEVLSNLAGSVLGGSELYSFIESFITGDTYYGISVAVIDSINDFTESLLKFHEKPSAKNLKQIFFDLSVLIGDSGENSYKFFDGLGLHWEDIKNGEFLSFKAGHETKLSVQYTTMMNALVEGNNERYEERYAETLETLLLTKTEPEAKSAIVSGIKGKLKESYLETEISYDDAIAILEKIGDKEPYFTIKEWDNAENDEYKKYSELKAAVVSGQGIDEEMAELTDNGVKEETVKEKLITAIKEAYKNGDITRDIASEYLKNYKEDFTDDDVYWQLREWDKQDSYVGDEKYSKYDDLVNAVEAGDFDSVVKEYVEHGTSATAIKKEISEKYKPLYQEAYLSGNHRTVNAIKEILNKLRVNGKRLYNQEDYLNWNKQAKEQKKSD